MTPAALVAQVEGLRALMDAVDTLADGLGTAAEDMLSDLVADKADNEKHEAVLTLVESISDLTGEAVRMATRLAEDGEGIRAAFGITD